MHHIFVVHRMQCLYSTVVMPLMILQEVGVHLFSKEKKKKGRRELLKPTENSEKQEMD